MFVNRSDSDQQTPGSLLIEHFRCPEDCLEFSVSEGLSNESGYFRFGSDAICFGQSKSTNTAYAVTDSLYDGREDVSAANGKVQLPFDPVQVVSNLRNERYKRNHSKDRKEIDANGLIRQIYYFLRPLMPVAVRKHLQREYFRGWEQIPFPRWPVDFSTERLFEELLVVAMNARNIKKLPFIWFWPEGAPSCAIMTHDVETAAGRDFCGQLMDINDSFDIKSAFQIVPEKRYGVPEDLLSLIRARGFELNVHDLNHDGHLMKSREEFLRRSVQINQHGRRFGASGFRSAMLHRNLEWYDALEFSYDMSVPNVAHLDPQRGGCCTVFPFFNGKLLELPVTMTQDYSLFHILQDYTIERWKEQINLIMANYGLMNFIVHPDYILGARERAVYESLLDYLRSLRKREGIWLALPREVDRWWRERSQMRLVEDAGAWRIEGQGHERARIAYAHEEAGRLSFTLDEPSEAKSTRLKSSRQMCEDPATQVPDSTGLTANYHQANELHARAGGRTDRSWMS